MKLTQQNNLPALALYRRPQCAQHRVLGKLLLKPSPGDPPTKGKGNRCSNEVANQHDQKSPPQSKKETSADGKNTTGKKKDITSRKKQRVANRSPGPPAHHKLL